LLADKISGNQVGIWLLAPEHLRLGTWDLLCSWSQSSGQTIWPRMALHLVHEAALCVNGLRNQRSLTQKGARGGEKIRQMRRFAESDKELARFYRENA